MSNDAGSADPSWRHSLVVYVVAVFAVGAIGYVPWVMSSYGLFPAEPVGLLVLLGGLSPTIAAAAAMYSRSGNAGVRRLFSAAGGTDVPRASLLLSLLLPFLIFFGAIALYLLVGGTYNFAGVGLLLFLPILLVNALVNVWEEIGWRGFALPELQRRYNALASGLMVGMIWSLWHWPHFAVLGSEMLGLYGSYLVFVVQTVVVSVIYASLYNWSKGNVVIATVFHAGFNTLGGLLSESAGEPVPILFVVVVQALIALVLLAAFGVDSVSREERIRGLRENDGSGCTDKRNRNSPTLK